MKKNILQMKKLLPEEKSVLKEYDIKSQCLIENDNFLSMLKDAWLFRCVNSILSKVVFEKNSDEYFKEIAVSKEEIYSKYNFLEDFVANNIKAEEQILSIAIEAWNFKYHLLERLITGISSLDIKREKKSSKQPIQNSFISSYSVTLTNKQLMDNFGVSKSTAYNLKKDNKSEKLLMYEKAWLYELLMCLTPTFIIILKPSVPALVKHFGKTKQNFYDMKSRAAKMYELYVEVWNFDTNIKPNIMQSEKNK